MWKGNRRRGAKKEGEVGDPKGETEGVGARKLGEEEVGGARREEGLKGDKAPARSLSFPPLFSETSSREGEEGGGGGEGEREGEGEGV